MPFKNKELVNEFKKKIMDEIMISDSTHDKNW
jgi:hypothetical protein